MNWSKYQLDLFDEVKNGNGNIVVKATAGAGKTSVLKEISFILSHLSLIGLAFNKDAASQLHEKIKVNGHMGRTLHSHGLSAICKSTRSRPKVNGWKYLNIIDDLMDEMSGSLRGYSDDELKEIKYSTRDIVEKGRYFLIDFDSPRDMMDLCDHFGIDIWGPEYRLAQRANEIGLANKKLIDYTDMVYMPVALNLKLDTYDIIALDEAQDVDKLKLELITRSLNPGGRVFAVGDPSQSINGFSGAMPNSIDVIIERTNAKVMPLSVCYRCPVSHVELASEIDPSIEPAPNAIQGKIESIEEYELPSYVNNGALILCRINAPLIGFALQLIQQGKPARVKGKDIGSNLISTVKKLEKLNGNFVDIHETMNRWARAEESKLLKKDYSEAAIGRLWDTVDCLDAFLGADVDSFHALERQIKELFSDDRAAIWLSSVHKAKGLEANQVFILKPNKMPLVWANQKGWEAQQEQNILFVARTRSKDELYLVNG